MGKLKLILVFCLMVYNNLNSQEIQMPEHYLINIKIADSLRERDKFLDAGKYYHMAFNRKDAFSIDFHRLLSAYSWEMAGFRDSALIDLYFVVYTQNFSQPTLLNDLFSKTKFFQTSKFKKIINRIYCNESIKKLIRVESAAHLLDSVYLIDQQNRSLKNDSMTSKQPKSLWNSELLNLKIIDSLYKEYGWLSYSQVGFRGSQAQFLVIQHSDLKTQIKWLPIVRKAVSECKLDPGSLALLIDRIKITRKQKQVYGTQVYFNVKEVKYLPLPIANSSMVNAKRSKIGMISIEQYLLGFN